MFRHPKYYKELRKRNKAAQVNAHSVSISDQAISPGSEGSALPRRAPGQGLKPQATSAKPQAPSSDKKE